MALYLHTSSVWSLKFYPPTLFERRQGVVRVFEERLQKALLNQPPKQAVNYLNVPCTSGSRQVSDVHLRTQARRGNLAASGLPWLLWDTSCKDSRLIQRYFHPKVQTFLLTLQGRSRKQCLPVTSIQRFYNKFDENLKSVSAVDVLSPIDR